MKNSTTQIPPRDPPSDMIRFPLPRSLHSKINEPIAYFPPLKLGHSRDSLPPLLFPLVPTRKITSEDVDCPGTFQGSVSANARVEVSVELPNPRDSWSYWTGGKSQPKEAHVSEKMQDKDAPSARQTADEKPDADLGGFELKKPGSEPQLIPNLAGPGFPEEPLQSPQNQHGQVTKEILFGPERICKPLSALPVAMIPMQQSGSIHKEPNPASMMTVLSSGGYNSPHITDSSPFPANDSMPGRGNLHGEHSHSRANRRSYSLTMSSHPPFRITQPNSDPGRQGQGYLPQGRPSTATNSRQLHRVKTGLYTTPDPLQKRYLLRHSTSGATHSRAAEKKLLQYSSGRSASNPHNQHYKFSPTTILYTNSYQPPYGTLTTPKRYTTRSLRSNNSTNFSYPRTYSEPSSSKRRSTSSGSIHSSTGYGDRFNATVLLGSKRNGSHSSHDTSGCVARRMSGGSREGVSRDFQGQLEVHSEMAQDSGVAQANEGACVVGEGISQPPSRSNFFIPDRPTASPVRSSSYLNVSEPRNRMSSSDHDMSPNSWRNSRMSLDGEVQDNGLTIVYTNSNTVFPLGVTAEVRYMDNFEFTTTIDATSRPYTPDRFVIDAGLTHHNSTATRNSKRSSGSRGSIRNIRKKSGSVGSTYTVSRSSSRHGRNVLRKTPMLDIWPNLKPIPKRPWDTGNDSLLPSPAPATATVGLGIVDAFRERRKVAKELEDAVDHPHTATTRAGPTRGIIRDNSPPALIRPGVYQPDASQSRLNSLARKGKAKYEATAREIRQHIAAQNESERVKRIDPCSLPTQEQGSTNLKKHKNSGNPSTMKSDNISRPETARTTAKATTEPQVTDADADVDVERIKSPTSASGYVYISTVYHESQRILEKIWERGIGGRLANLSKQNNTARNLKYGSAGKKVKVYMRGARGESLTVFEKIGKGLGIRKGKASTPVEQTEFDANESDPFGIGVCGAVDVTEGRGTRDSDGWNENGFSRESPIGVWKEFEESELVDPVKLKLEGEGSKKYWSSRDEVEVETKTWWGRVRNLVKK